MIFFFILNILYQEVTARYTKKLGRKKTLSVRAFPKKKKTQIQASILSAGKSSKPEKNNIKYRL